MLKDFGSAYAMDQWQEIRAEKDERNQLLKKIELGISNIKFNLEHYPTQEMSEREYSTEELRQQVTALETTFHLSGRHVDIGIG
jgi:polyhydroxyalkanoate synthesis regulator phasin